VDQFGFEMGKKATRLLLKRIEADTFDFTPEHHTIKTQLIERGTC